MRRAIFLLAVLPVLLAAASPPPARIVKPFTLKAGDGTPWSFLEAMKGKKALVVLFLGTECPVNNQYLPILARLHTHYAEKEVVFVGINSNALDTPTRILAHARANKVPFPVLKDPANLQADAFGARRSPEAFVLSPAGKILYQGRIDDQIGIGFRRKEATRRDLAVALDETLAGKAVSVPFTDAPGCLIARAIAPKATGKITYARHAARIFQNRCQECHRAGQVGPMPLTTYEEIMSWSPMIEEVLTDGRMPPWHADPRHGKFANNRAIPKAEKETLLAWIKEGCPKGDLKDMPAPKKFSSGWGIGKPDIVIPMPKTFDVPAEMPARGVRYQYFRVPTNYAEDRWIQAAEARPGAREVVHHIIVYVIDPKDRRNRPGRGVDGIGTGFLTSYAPGDSPLILEPGQAKRLPKGAWLVFQLHYTPDGVARKDRSSLGIVWAKKPPRNEVKTRAIAQRFFMITPFASNHEVVSHNTFKQETELLALFPHMHVRGKSFKYEAKYPDGKREVILDVPKYDFNWQSNYRLSKPLKLPAGTQITCTAHFDNSSGNPNNPDPKKFVFWGDQTWEEMMIGFVDYTVPLK